MMSTALGGPRAVAVDLRRRDTGAVLGVALLVPSRRHVSFLTDPAGIPASHDLSADAWREIDDWTVQADAGLPAEPALLNPLVLAPLVLEEARAFLSVRRFASLRIPQISRDDLTPPGEESSSRAADIARGGVSAFGPNPPETGVIN